ncbi:FAS-associated death domain protein-like [Ptychodera flava]|uniref:FAS-associated death domain protein-like n=1 Tax=Ptychodera flava TaxID=63121 RepID=UPI00396A247F
MTGIDPLRKLFRQISKQLTKSEVSDLKECITADQISASTLESLDKASAIFIELQNKGLIKHGDLQLLKDLLSEIQRHPLVETVERFERERKTERHQFGGTSRKRRNDDDDDSDDDRCRSTPNKKLHRFYETLLPVWAQKVKDENP